MLRFSKIFIVLFFILMIFNVTVFASDIDMNLTQNEDQSNLITSNSVDETTANELPATTSSDGIEGSAAPSNVSSIAQENMSFSNILNILIITVGVIIILLAIAILIRLK